MKKTIKRYLTVKEAQQTILQSVDESIAHFEATGLHITLDEFIDWTEAMKLDRNAKLPECHA